MKKNIIKYFFASMVLLSTSCKDDFLQEKRDMTGVNEDVFKDPVLAQAYVDYLYGLFLPANNGTPWIQTQTASENGGYNNVFTQTTDELAGETDYNKVWASILNTNNHANKYFGQVVGTGVNNNVWTRLKQINIFLSEIDKYGIEEDARNKLKGQMYFWRAWQYFELVRLYGGVPLILEPQNPSMVDKDINSIPRSKTSECIDQICADLDMAKTLLPLKWPNGAADWGRITSGAAAAVKGRVLLTWASPLFNPTDDQARWQRSYDANLEARDLLTTNNNFGLFETGGTADGKAWGDMWFTEVNNKEAIIVYGFNNVAAGGAFTKNSGWEQAVRPRSINGAGSVSPTKQIVDAFPMLDGKKPGDPSSAYTYSANKFYKNRDPRFAKTFAYNGSVWPYSGNNFKVWTYSWKKTATAAYTPTETNPNSSGIYLRKASNPGATFNVNNFSQSGTDYMEFRFAEVLLNLAESAIGINRLNEGLEGIEKIRARAGIINGDGHYGLSDVVGDRNKLFRAVLDERKIEFAYEGKRFYDLRRWMLFDNHTGMNTRLGIPVLNGTRRTGYRITVKTTSGTEYIGTNDPLLKPASGNAPIIDRDAIAFPSGVPNYDAYVDYLYDNHFQVIEKDDLDPTNPANWSFKWYPEYYYFGIHQNLLNASPYLEQTKGWSSMNGMGTFDPLL
jgi:hypothetical protein